MTQCFDSFADTYDRWYDAPEGKAIFQAELKCLELALGKRSGRWLEVGVGTGRFAAGLGIAMGIDPSPNMRAIAAGRGITTLSGTAEAIPFPVASFDGVLMALTLCFTTNPQQAMAECRRVLRPEGRLLLGIVPADSSWGKEYLKKASNGHPLYSHARFRTADEIQDLAEKAGFILAHGASALFWKPDEPPSVPPRVEKGIVKEAGFLGLLFNAV